MTGIVKFYNEKKGYGFIRDGSGDEYFFHISKFTSKGGELPCSDMKVIFDSTENKRGLYAVNVSPV